MDTTEKTETTTVLRDKTEKQRASLDQALLKICALGLPITIYVKGQLETTWKYDGLFSWFAGCWVLSLVAVIVSYKLSEMGYKQTRDNLKRGERRNGPALKLTTWANRLSLSAFLVGLALLVVFARFNLF